MPQFTTIRPQFARAARDALGGLSISQAAYKTGISYEWIRKMVQHGHVPSQTILERFASGLGADLGELRRAAGYDQPTDAVEAVDLALRGVELPEQGKEEIRQFVKLVREKYTREAENQRQEN